MNTQHSSPLSPETQDTSPITHIRARALLQSKSDPETRASPISIYPSIAVQASDLLNDIKTGFIDVDVIADIDGRQLVRDLEQIATRCDVPHGAMGRSVPVRWENPSTIRPCLTAATNLET